MVNSELHVVVLAAGEGKRMRSSLPKVIQKLGGLPLLEHVLRTIVGLNPTKIHVVYGFSGEKLKAEFPDAPVNWVHQAEQNGTGHAVLQCLDEIPRDSKVLVVYGDTPLVPKTDLSQLIESARQGISVLTMDLESPKGYGRIVRNAQGELISIVEELDATEDERRISEVNSGIIACQGEHLHQYLPLIASNNQQQELYLTDLISIANQQGAPIYSVLSADPSLLKGVNDRQQLARLERRYQQICADRLLEEGVTLLDPSRLDIRGSVSVGRDVVIDVNVIFEGTVILGDGVVVGANSIIRNSDIGKSTRIDAMSIVENARIGERCIIGPFARIRMGTDIGADSKIGNFVETKKAIIADNTKISHLSYIGDADIGSHVNIGAGTVTCNYDGVNKHKTLIGDSVFVGSGTQLVAPVEIKAGATIGAGSTITKNAPSDKLTLARSGQITINGWKKPKLKGN